MKCVFAVSVAILSDGEADGDADAEADGTDSEASSPPGSPHPERATVVSEEPADKDAHKRRPSLANLYRGPGGIELGKDVLSDITMFRRKQKKVSISWKLMMVMLQDFHLTYGS